MLDFIKTFYEKCKEPEGSFEGLDLQQVEDFLAESNFNLQNVSNALSDATKLTMKQRWLKILKEKLQPAIEASMPSKSTVELRIRCPIDRWSFGKSLIFSITTITTIGYGSWRSQCEKTSEFTFKKSQKLYVLKKVKSCFVLLAYF